MSTTTLLTVEQVAERLNCSTKHVWRLIDAHDLGHIPISDSRERRMVRVPERRLEEWLAKREVAPR